MKRRLIDFDVYRKIHDESLSSAETELLEAEDVLAKALNLDGLTLHCYSESDVTYMTPDHTFVHANYDLDKQYLTLENVEELVIDDDSARKESRGHLKAVLEELLNNNPEKANEAFMSYMKLPSVRRNLIEGAVEFSVEKLNKSPKKRGSQDPAWVRKRVEAKKKSQAAISPSEKKRASDMRKRLKKQKGGDSVRVHARFKPQKQAKHMLKAGQKKMTEWATLVENVSGYLDYQEFGPNLKDTAVRRDERGNVVALKIPTEKVRNENKILQFNWKTLNHELTILRGKMKKVNEDASFCRAMADLRKCNALSDAENLQNVLEAVVTRWPDLVYLTQTELAEQIQLALEAAGERNYDDQTCDFMSEGILRTATGAYTGKVAKIIRLSGKQADTNSPELYEQFQTVAHQFYPTLDGTAVLEMQVFADLYNALVEVHKQASGEGNEAVRLECHRHLKSLSSVLRQEADPAIGTIEEAAGFLSSLVETNLESGEWTVSNSVHHTVNGDHPAMAEKARKGYTPASDFSGDWGDVAPVSDGKSYKNGLADEMRDNAWGNWSSEDTWPGLNNPYVPKPFGDYTMKGEEGADKAGESDWSRWQSGDTWPELKNPYWPEEKMKPDQYKMKSDNLVIEK